MTNGDELINLPLEVAKDFKRISEDSVECKTSRSKIKYTSRQGVTPLKAHLKVEKHLKALELKVLNKADDDTFHFDLLEIMISCNFSINAFDNPKFNYFFETHCKRKLYKIRLAEKKKTLKEKDFYIMFDEAPDIKGRKIVNILAGEIDPSGYKKPFILNTIELENVTGEVITSKIIFEICKLIEKEEYTINFRLLLSDKAAYCLLAGKKLKEIFPNLKHNTCLAHALHNLLETIRGNALGLKYWFLK